MLIITGGVFFDSDEMIFYDNKQIKIENGQIVDIQKRFNHSNQETLNLSGYTIVPGWIDTHVHLSLSGQIDPIKDWFSFGILQSTIRGVVRYLPAYLKAGVTVIRDLGGDGDVALEIKKATTSGLVEGPEILTAGKALTMTGGHLFQISHEVDGREEVRKIARMELKKGVDLLKVIATGGILTPGMEPGVEQLTAEEIRPVVEEAHKAGKKVAVHAEGREGILNSLKAGVDTIEHAIGLDYDGIDLIKNYNVYLIPTLAAPRLILRNQAQLPKEMIKKAKKIVEIHKESFALAYRRGCNIAVGTDAGTPFNPHGGFYLELAELLNDGMRKEEVLRAASLNGAKALGLEKRVGNIAVGLEANLTLIEGDLKDNWYENVKGVIHRGRILRHQ